MVRWYYLVGDKHQGPFTLDELAVFMQARTVSGNTLVWSEGRKGWAPLGYIPELMERLRKETEESPLAAALGMAGNVAASQQVAPSRTRQLVAPDEAPAPAALAQSPALALAPSEGGRAAQSAAPRSAASSAWEFSGGTAARREQSRTAERPSQDEPSLQRSLQPLSPLAASSATQEIPQTLHADAPISITPPSSVVRDLNPSLHAEPRAASSGAPLTSPPQTGADVTWGDPDSRWNPVNTHANMLWEALVEFLNIDPPGLKGFVPPERWKRFLGGFMDVVLLGVLWALLYPVVTSLMVVAGDFGLGSTFLDPFVYLAIAGTYLALLPSLTGWTLGKFAVGLEITDCEGNKPTLGIMLLRLSVSTLSWLLFGIGFFWMARSTSGRSLPDHISGTVVRDRFAAPHKSKL